MGFKILLLTAAVLLRCNGYVEGRISEVSTEGCSVTKSCFKLPSGCKDLSDCDGFLSWVPATIDDGTRYLEIEMFGKVESDKGYIAIGFNKVKGMNDAGVVACYIDSSGSAIKFTGAYNRIYDNEFVASSNFLVTSGPGSEERLGGYYNGSSKSIVCRVRRLLVPNDNMAELKNLSSPNTYHVLISRSQTVLSAGLGKHFGGATGKAVSDQAFDFGASNVTIVETSEDVLIKTHGALMIVAWLLCANFGIIMSRYMKPMWPDKTLFGQKVWFQIHRAVQILCVILSIIAFVIIFVRIGGYSHLKTLPSMAHPILGIVVMSLALLNPITAIFRPGPDARKRPIFNWVHFCIGSMAQIFAVVTMFIGVKLQKVGGKFSSSPYPFWILVGCVIFVFVMEIAFAVEQHCMSKTSTNIQDNSLGDSSRYIHADGVKRQVNQGRRQLLLAIYFLGIAGCTTALVVLLFVY